MKEPIQLATMTIDLYLVDEIYRDGDVVVIYGCGYDIRLSSADIAFLNEF